MNDKEIADAKQQLFMTVYGLFYKLKEELIAEALNEYWEKHK